MATPRCALCKSAAPETNQQKPTGSDSLCVCECAGYQRVHTKRDPVSGSGWDNKNYGHDLAHSRKMCNWPGELHSESGKLKEGETK